MRGCLLELNEMSTDDIIKLSILVKQQVRKKNMEKDVFFKKLQDDIAKAGFDLDDFNSYLPGVYLPLVTNARYLLNIDLETTVIWSGRGSTPDVIAIEIKSGLKLSDIEIG